MRTCTIVRLEDALADRRLHRGQAHERRRSARSDRPTAKSTPEARCAAIGEKMSRPWKLEVIVGSMRSRFSSDARLGDAAERLGGGDEQAVVRPDQDVAAGDPQGHRQTLRADTRVDDRDMGAYRHVRQGEDEGPRALTDGVARDLVADVDDVGVGADAEHHAATDRRSGRPEVGEEGDDRAHRRMVSGPGRTEAAPGGGSAPLRERTIVRAGGGLAVAIGMIARVSAVEASPRPRARTGPCGPVRAGTATG